MASDPITAVFLQEGGQPVLRLALTFAVALGLAGCAAGRVSDCPHRDLIGQSVHGAAPDTLREAGKTVRVLYPDSFLGFGRDETRVNLIRDEAGTIQAVTCG
jgi:hypothetical protein